MFCRNLYSKSGRKSCLYNIKRLRYRKVENTFEIRSHDLGEILQKVNGIDEKLEFTMEKASEGNLPLLDCIINLNGKREIITKVYKKPNSLRSVYPFLIKSTTTCKLTGCRTS